MSAHDGTTSEGGERAARPPEETKAEKLPISGQCFGAWMLENKDGGKTEVKRSR